jgi:TPP-dependent pyruvate/acetoin dehydrogenase alpha subunit
MTSKAAVKASETAAPDREVSLDLYRQMRLIRSFEDTVQALFQRGQVHGTTHLYSGQEAGAVGVCGVLREGDRAAGTYRGHGHSLAMGVSPQGLMDEMLGRATGVCGGRGGSMNIIDLEHGLIGCFGIIGGSIAAATGAALAAQKQGRQAVAVAFFGEGTSNQAYFHECLNFAQVLKLPIVFVCENNLYMEFTPIEDVTAGEIIARPRAMGITSEQIDGNDVWAVRAAAEKAVAHARSGEGPVFIESLTYRFVGHSRSDPARYRKEGELERWRARDPLLVARARLTEEFGVDAETLDAIDVEVTAELDQVAEAAMAAPYPDPVTDAATEFKT